MIFEAFSGYLQCLWVWNGVVRSWWILGFYHQITIFLHFFLVATAVWRRSNDSAKVLEFRLQDPRGKEDPCSLNLEAEHEPLEKEIPFKQSSFSASMINFGRCTFILHIIQYHILLWYHCLSIHSNQQVLWSSRLKPNDFQEWPATWPPSDDCLIRTGKNISDFQFIHSVKRFPEARAILPFQKNLGWPVLPVSYYFIIFLP